VIQAEVFHKGVILNHNLDLKHIIVIERLKIEINIADRVVTVGLSRQIIELLKLQKIITDLIEDIITILESLNNTITDAKETKVDMTSTRSTIVHVHDLVLPDPHQAHSCPIDLPILIQF